MNNIGRVLIFAISTAAMGANGFAAAADSPTNPFQGIPRANVFRLQDPPEPVAPTPPPIPLPPLKLTGVLDGWGKSLAFLEVGVPPAPPNPAKIALLTLTAGESEAGVEVLNVNVKAGTAQVKVMNIVTNLTLNNNVPPAPALATPALPATTLNRQLLAVPSASPAAGLSRDQNALVIEAERERLRQAGDMRANLMPVTHLTPTGAPGTGAPSP